MIVENELLEELKKATLDILVFFKDFCQENQLAFFLAWGSCLGAVRHHGFIPWDDDIDICMAPEDYHRLLELWPPQTSKGKYTLCDATDTYCDRHTTLTIRNNETTYIRPCDQDIDTHHGIMIEIGAYSYLPLSALSRARQTLATAVYNIYRTQRVPNIGSGLQRIGVQLMLTALPSSRLRYMAWKRAEQIVHQGRKNGTKYVRNATTLSTLFLYYPIEIFEEIEWLPFENTMMPVPKRYDEYLTICYGENYMSLPPVNERVSLHDVVFIDPHHSYLDYRGVKYLKNKKQ